MIPGFGRTGFGRYNFPWFPVKMPSNWVELHVVHYAAVRFGHLAASATQRVSGKTRITAQVECILCVLCVYIYIVRIQQIE